MCRAFFRPGLQEVAARMMSPALILEKSSVLKMFIRGPGLLQTLPLSQL
jgi:hypothetical protein